MREILKNKQLPQSNFYSNDQPLLSQTGNVDQNKTFKDFENETTYYYSETCLIRHARVEEFSEYRITMCNKTNNVQKGMKIKQTG